LGGYHSNTPDLLKALPLQIFNGGDYLVFAIGMVLYFMASVLSSFCKKIDK
jgi:hypothetical protein